MNRNDRRIGVGAIVVAAMALLGLYLGGSDQQPPVATSQEDSAQHPFSADSKEASRHRSYYSSADAIHYSTEQPQPQRFYFDPNTADSTQLQNLGLQKWQIRNIYKYRAHGGIYRRKEDFARLYGLTAKQYRELEPYIRISSDYQPAANLVAPVEKHTTIVDSAQQPVKLNKGEYIVLNTADTTQLKRVPGIGSFYAGEIIRHGKWLGGYVSVDQLDEIDGFPSESKKYFIIKDAHPVKVNINKMTLQQLRRHPYINYFQAKTITDYRRLHGPISSLDELRLSDDFTPEAIERLRPYVEY